MPSFWPAGTVEMFDLLAVQGALLVYFRPHACEQQLARGRRHLRTIEHVDLALLRTDVPAHSRDLVVDTVELHGVFKGVRYVAELPDHLGVAELAGPGISRSAEGHRKDQRQIMTMRYRLRAEIAHSFYYLPLVFA